MRALLAKNLGRWVAGALLWRLWATGCNLPDEPKLDEGRSDAGGGSGDASQSADGTSDSASNADGAPDPCPGSDIWCEGSCLDPVTSADHCGKCGHSCGGGQCVWGVCQPHTLISGLSVVRGLAVDAQEVFIASGGGLDGDSLIQACPITGCVLAPRQVASGDFSVTELAATSDSLVVRALESGPIVVFALGKSGANKNPWLAPYSPLAPPGGLIATGNDVYYRGRETMHPEGGLGSHRVRRCTGLRNGSCAADALLDQDIPRAFGAEGANVYYIRDNALMRCDAQLGCREESVVLPFAGNVSAVLPHQGVVYLLANAAPPHQLRSCPQAGCATPAVVVSVERHVTITAVAVDDSSIYWLEADRVRACALPDCIGGPRTLAADQKSPTSIVTSGNFVYWANAGTPSGDGGVVANTASVRRVAK